MFKRVEDKKKDEINIRNEPEGEESFGGIGNEANIRNDLVNNISNEENNERILEGMKENEPYGSGIGERISKEDGLDLLEGLERIPEEEKVQAPLEAGPDAVPTSTFEKLDWIPVEEPDDEEDLATNKAHRRKKKTVPKKDKKSSEKPKEKPWVKASDLGVADEDMKPIKGWNFEPERFPQRQTQSGAGKLATKIAYYTGKTIGKALSFLLKLAAFPYGAYLLYRKYSNWKPSGPR